MSSHLPSPTAPRRGRAAGVALLIGLALATVLVLGPRPHVEAPDEIPPVPQSAAELEAYLLRAEGAFDDIVPGTERRILWADPGSPARTDLAVVYLHGFSATHRETAPLTERLAEALEANAYLSRLTGHGRTGEALGEASATAWLRDAAEAVEIGRALGRRVVLLGVSTGGTLATWAAARADFAPDLAALVLVSPNYGVRDGRAWILKLPWGTGIARLVQGAEYAFDPASEAHARYWTERYPVDVLPEMAALTALVDRELASSVGVPTLVFVSPEDRIIDPGRVESVFGWLGAGRKELVRVSATEDPMSHVLAGDILAPQGTDALVSEIVDFVRSTR